MTITTIDEQNTMTGLVRAAQDGDRAALGMLIERCEQSVLSFCLRQTRDANEAQELAQDVFIQVLPWFHFQ